jgi:asparagine synthase (glutamine-hydrolysing)
MQWALRPGPVTIIKGCALIGAFASAIISATPRAITANKGLLQALQRLRHMLNQLFGQPSFSHPELQACAQSQGLEAAWRLAFSRFGMQAAQHAQGAFAVALQLADGRVFMAVDRFAIHPLCYRVQGDGVRCHSRADALAGTDAQLDPQALFDYLYAHAIASPRTVFQGVCRLPAGHCASFVNGQLTVQAYWQAEFAPPAGAVSFEALKTEFRGLLKEAVSSPLDGGKRGCFLSGGTDSSTVAGMLKAASAGQPVSAYSIGFEAEGYDEMVYARLAAKHFGVEHHEYYVTPADLVRSIPEVAAYYDQPFGNSSAVPAFYCAKMARDDGVTRILAGDGGDELFGGNSRYAKMRVFGVYDGVPAGLRRVIEPIFKLPMVAKAPLLSKGASYIQQAKVPMPDRLQTYNLLLRLGLSEVLTPGFLRQVNTEGPAQQQREVWAQSRAASQVDRNLAFDWRYTLAETDLPKVCGTTALAGLQVAFPMLDHKLVDFSMRLPGDYKLRGLKLRWFFKEALRGFLPDEIITKKKQGFGLPFGVWAVRNETLRKLAQDSLGQLSTRGFIQPAFIKALMDHRLAEHPGYFGEMVWILMMLEQWLRRHAPNYVLKD